MKKLYKLTMSDGMTAGLVYAKGRQSACMKLTGMRVKAAMEPGKILHVAKVDTKG